MAEDGFKMMVTYVKMSPDTGEGPLAEFKNMVKFGKLPIDPHVKKVQIVMDEYERVHQNAIREQLLGLKPIVKPTKACLRCMVPKWLRIPVPEGKESFCEKLSIKGAIQNKIFISILYHILCIVICFALFLLTVTQNSWLTPSTYGLFYACLAIFLSIISEVPSIRCILLLCLPDLFCVRGRYILLTIALMLTMSGPLLNVVQNIELAGEVNACVQDAVSSDLHSAKEGGHKKAAALSNMLNEATLGFRQVAKSVGRSLKATRDAFRKIAELVMKPARWLAKSINICRNGPPSVRLCQKFERKFDLEKWGNSYSDRSIGATDFLPEVTRAIFSFNIDRILTLFCRIVFMPLDMVCEVPGKIIKFFDRTVVQEVKKLLKKLENSIAKELHYEIEFERNFTHKTKVNATGSAEIKKRLENWKEGAIGVLNFMKLMLEGLLFIWLIVAFFAAALYRFQFLTKISYDNYFIDQYLYDIEETRAEKEMQLVLPLFAIERFKYLDSWLCPWLTWFEFLRMLGGFLVILVSGIYATVVIFMDLLVHAMILILTDFINQGTLSDEQPKSSMPRPVAVGNGSLSKAYQGMFNQLGVGQFQDPSDMWQKCIREPAEPDYGTYKSIFYIYLACVFLNLISIYVLRLRHKICGIFYPQKMAQRAAHLHNKIHSCRGKLVDVIKRQVAAHILGAKGVHKIDLLERIGHQCTCIGSIMRLFKVLPKHCLKCNASGPPDDLDNFRHCVDFKCSGVYCINCASNTDKCLVCQNPFIKEDLDIDPYRDSSDEEELANWKRKVERIKKKRARALKAGGAKKKTTSEESSDQDSYRRWKEKVAKQRELRDHHRKEMDSKIIFEKPDDLKTVDPVTAGTVQKNEDAWRKVVMEKKKKLKAAKLQRKKEHPPEEFQTDMADEDETGDEGTKETAGTSGAGFIGTSEERTKETVGTSGTAFIGMSEEGTKKTPGTSVSVFEEKKEDGTVTGTTKTEDVTNRTKETGTISGNTGTEQPITKESAQIKSVRIAKKLKEAKKKKEP